MTLQFTSGFVQIFKSRAIRLLTLLTFTLVLSLAILSGCGNQSDSPQGVAQLGEKETSSQVPKENVIEPSIEPSTEPSTETAPVSPEDVNIKIYKDQGDAVDAFYTAFENKTPIFLYFYTDT